VIATDLRQIEEMTQPFAGKEDDFNREGKKG
jgi:hypothetical protein